MVRRTSCLAVWLLELISKICAFQLACLVLDCEGNQVEGEHNYNVVSDVDVSRIRAKITLGHFLILPLMRWNLTIFCSLIFWFPCNN